ncbi:hypothetical protein ACLKA7_003246 [Drosophila subpalustris]
MWLLLQLTILTGLAHYSSALKYRFVPENDDIFSACPNQPKNVLDLNGLFDLSEIQFNLASGFVMVSGNVTSVWNIQPSDRIEVSLELQRFDRGEWIKTIRSINVFNFCAVLYDENQYWYKFWTKNVVNSKDVKSKCLSPGTKLVHEMFKVDMTFDLSGPSMNGLHKVVFRYKAINAMQHERDTSICLEILGEMSRI